jgi:hypothetical protein
MPAPRSRFLQVGGQVGTLQAAIRHSLDIQGQCPCLLGIVPPSHHGNTHPAATVLHYAGRCRSLSCATQLSTYGAQHAVRPGHEPRSHKCSLSPRQSSPRPRRIIGRGWGYEARFFHSSSAGASMPPFLCRSYCAAVYSARTAPPLPRVAASPDQPLRHSAVHGLSRLQVPTPSRSAGGINIEGAAIPVFLQFTICGRRLCRPHIHLLTNTQEIAG